MGVPDMGIETQLEGLKNWNFSTIPVPITLDCNSTSGSEFVAVFQWSPLNYEQAWDACIDLLNGTRLAHLDNEAREICDSWAFW